MPKPHPQKFKDYTRAYFNGSGQLTAEKRDELILTYTPLIKYIATRLASRLPTNISLDDLISSGIIGLIDSIDKFDITKNVQFKTYAEFRIKGAMLDELRSLDWVPRSVRGKIHQLEHATSTMEQKLGRSATDEEMAQTMNISLDEFHKLLDETKSISFMDIDLLTQNSTDLRGSNFSDFMEQDSLDPFLALSFSQIRDLVAQAVSELSHKEQLVISLYYFEELTMKEIGLVLDYTESRISQMHSKAVLRLRSKLKKNFS
ncbi:MAG: FliA/WhiG family RNA polymerase sigma factor [Proteobacteria bacterium]|nr:FliA/WhiG family RNA polymerase sigma factor [Desulfobulbaceae bacterium]MBU4153132.1 FliA/WhiG family RNA polymerase sigma factor [Pseudomonadota bacterium]MDP2106019.1 FliA/WhiG family RNA polymerase sigma factor [Desulfobulbaceae bacterium]